MSAKLIQSHFAFQVPQLPGQLLGNSNGGMTVYYIQPGNGQKVTAFKKVRNIQVYLLALNDLL